MKANALCLLSIMSFASLTAHAAPIQLSNNTRIEVVESFSTRDLWNTAKPNTAAGMNVIVESRLFDPESRPRNGKWHGCAIVMIGTEDLGIQPVAIRIWTVKPCDLKIRAETTSVTDADFSMRMGVREVFKVHVSKDLQVSVGGKVVGHIKD